MKRKRQISIGIICLLLLLMGIVPSAVYAKDSDEKVVKVAYLISPGFQEGGDGEYKSGQGYEYLQKIASYTGWTYEYVYGNFGDLLTMLENGDIDLMGNLSYTDERAQLISYSSYEQGREAFYLYVCGNDSGIRADDYSTINGKKIGVSASSYQEKVWNKWCEEHNVQCDVIEFYSLKERQDALNNGLIDASIGSLMPNRNEATPNWKSVFSFGNAPYYFCVNKAKPELLRELNNAQGRILNENPNYNDELSTRYLQNGLLNRSNLEDEEIEWLMQHQEPLKIGCLEGYLPISDIDDDGVMHGVLPDLFEAIQDNYKDYGLSYEMVVYKDYKQMLIDLKDGTIDIAAPIYGDYWNADQEGISLTNSFMSTTMLLLQKGSYSADQIQKLGIDRQSPIQTVYAKIYYPNCEQVLYASMNDVVQALKKGEIDAALSTACTYHVSAILNADLGKMNRSTLPASVNLSMAVARRNPELMSILNKGLSGIGDMLVYNSLALNSNVEKKVTLTDYIAANPLATIIVSLSIITILVVIIIRLNNANTRARTDAMTGLLNKVSMHELTKDELKNGGVLFMADIDNFKTVNDLLGHESGDVVINYFADSLQKIFRRGDLICRFGGDEFLIFISDATTTDIMIQNKVNQMQNALAECEVIQKNEDKVNCSVSVGVFVLTPGNNFTYTDAFRKVDAALYEAKKKGKKTFVITK